MAEEKLLSSTPSRRGVLATGVKVAYATPLVLASMKAAPVFAQDIQADLSEDLKTEPAIEGQLDDISNQIISAPGSVTTAMVNSAQSALVAFNNDYQAIITQVGALVPGTTALGSGLIASVGGPFTLPSPVPSGIPAAVTGGILKTTNTINDAVGVYNAYYSALTTALNNLALAPTNSAAQVAFSQASIAFKKVEDAVEGALLSLAGSTP